MMNRSWIVAVSFLALMGCQNNDGAGAAKPAGSAGAVSPEGAAAPAVAKDGLVDLELVPVGLKIKVAAGGKGAMDMSRDDKKSVTVDIGGGTSLNISETTEDLAAIKKTYEGDKVLYPFKKWEKEDASMAILQFENAGKTGYIGVALKDVGGKKYRCQTTGLDGVASVELAAKYLESCNSLSAK